ncbi:Septum formation initiator [Desulfonatronospira thiodismutans ASO3-1]|uniref:Septum formation initiator n=1 Tax=Desulfonatronospira thiodismutans ASO3-1 TaxID=555779 RepID=D6STE6_9BACT|nr:septum formation initiator family protein [Desulfonatronospira thiodismutans]EFI33962.1 Septum formation initiator [Desulfonatronospira thiodismutans ASO3-1]
MLIRLIVLILLGANIVLAYQLYWGPSSVPVYLENKETFQELKQENKALLEENKQLSKEIKHLRSRKDFIKEAVRKEMGYVREDEVMYYFSD